MGKLLHTILTPISLPISFIYGLVINIRHFLYDKGILKSYSFYTPTICVGNITVGGTGKTPHVEYLLSLIAKKRTVAVLSRGYKRKTTGFLYVETTDSATRVGDEPLQIKRKFPNVIVAVEADRKKGIRELEKNKPDIIILDDAFQHRRIRPKISIVLIDYNRPVWNDYFLPYGSLRDSKKRLQKANIIVITKCPLDISSEEKNSLRKKLNLLKGQKLYFTGFLYDSLKPAFSHFVKETKETNTCLAVSGIAQPKPFYTELVNRYNNVIELSFPDHHNFSDNDIRKIHEYSLNTDTVITTEKDYMRLMDKENLLSHELKAKLYYLPIKVKQLGGYKIN